MQNFMTVGRGRGEAGEDDNLVLICWVNRTCMCHIYRVPIRLINMISHREKRDRQNVLDNIPTGALNINFIFAKKKRQ